MKTHVVEALRFGDREMHSYVVGVYSTRAFAQEVANAHREWRGGKYECVVITHNLDDYSTEEMEHHSRLR